MSNDITSISILSEKLPCMLAPGNITSSYFMRPCEMVYFTLLCEMSLNKQLLDEVEHDIMNYQNRGLCNTDTKF